MAINVNSPPTPTPQSSPITDALNRNTDALNRLSGGGTNSPRGVTTPPVGPRPTDFRGSQLPSAQPMSPREEAAFADKMAKSIERGLRDGLRKTAGGSTASTATGSPIAGVADARQHSAALMQQGFTSERAWAMGLKMSGSNYLPSPVGGPTNFQPGSAIAGYAAQRQQSDLARLQGIAGTPTAHRLGLDIGQPPSGPGGAISGYNAPHEGNPFEGLNGPSRGGTTVVPGSASALAVKGFIALQVARKVSHGATAVADSYYDPYITNEQIGRKLFRDVVPGGGEAQKVADAFSGRSAGMQQAEVRGQQQTNQFRYEQQLASYNLGFQPGQVGRESRSGLLDNAQAVLMPNIDRTTSTGEREYRETARLLPVKRELAKADRERTVANKELTATQDQLIKIETRGLELEKRRAELQIETTRKDAGSGPQLQGKLRELEATEGAIRDNRSLSIEARQARMAASNRAAEAEGNFQQVQAQEKLGQAQNITERAERASGRAKSLGRMNPAERVQAEAYFRLVESNKDNLDLLPNEVITGAESFAPERVGKYIENRGLKSSQFRYGQQAAPEEFGAPGETPQSLRQRANDLENQAAQQQLRAEAGIAKAGAEAGKDMAATVGRAMESLRDSFNREIETRFRIQRNTP